MTRLDMAESALRSAAVDGVVRKSMADIVSALGVKTGRSAQRLLAKLQTAGRVTRESGCGRGHLTVLRFAGKVDTKGGKGGQERWTKVDMKGEGGSHEQQPSLPSKSLKTAELASSAAVETTATKGDRKVDTERWTTVALSPALEALIEALLRTNGVPARSTATVPIFAPVVALHSANTQADIQPLPDDRDERRDLEEFAKLAKDAGKSDMEVEADQLRLLRHPVKDHVHAAVASVLLKVARRKPVTSPVGLVFSLLRSGDSSFEAGAVANWREVDALLEAAKNAKPSRPLMTGEHVVAKPPEKSAGQKQWDLIEEIARKKQLEMIAARESKETQA